MKRITVLSATALAAALALSGCAGGNEAGTPATTSPAAGTSTRGMDHGGMMQSPPASASDNAGHNDADAMFARMMIPHHQQAVEMSETMLAKQDLDPQVTKLAEQIKAAQGPEIETMAGWLKAWGEPTMMSGDQGMDGMMGDDDMAALEKAQGTEASKMFLTQMTAHHEGAIKMAQQEVSNGSNPEAIALAEKIIKDQQAEIQKMKDLLAAL
jgi:uncharacterized protein (DUF305 family)